MITVNERKWQEHYNELKEYISIHHQLPNKKVVHNRGLLNWWKYQKRLFKEGKLSDERLQLLRELSGMRNVRREDGMFG